MEKNEENQDEKLPKEGEIVNNGVLSLKDITEEEVAKIKRIKNNGIIIVPERYLGIISAKVTQNNGVTVPYIDGMKIYAGKTRINADTLRNFEEPTTILQAGHLVFEDDVTPELIKEKIKNFRNYGKTKVTTAGYGVLMSKCSENMGKIERTNSDDDE